MRHPPDPPLLLLTPRYTPDSRALRVAAERRGWDVVRLGDWRLPAEARERALVFYGEPLLAAVIAGDLPYALLGPTPGWLPALPEAYRKRAVRLTTLGEARRLRAPAFVKPPNEKSFPAAVYSSGVALPGPDILPDETAALVAEPVEWELEFRLFIQERRIVARSPYLRDGALAQNDEGDWPAAPDELAAAQAFATGLLADARVSVPPAVALDIGVIRGRGWAVVEANAAWASGLYGCDPDAVLPALQRAIVPRGALSADERAWTLY